MVTRKKKLENRLESLITIDIVEGEQTCYLFSRQTHQLRVLLSEFHQFLEEHTFKSPKQQKKYFKKHIIPLYIYYFAFHQISLILSSIPFNVTERINFINREIDLLKQYKVKHAPLFQEFCMNELEVTDQDIISFYQAQPDTHLWCLFDEKQPTMLPVYFDSLKVILYYFTLMFMTVEESNNNLLKWSGTNTDLCILVRNLATFNNSENSEIELARAFERIYDVQVSKYYYQSLHSYKKGKGTKSHIINRLKEISDEWEDSDLNNS